MAAAVAPEFVVNDSKLWDYSRSRTVESENAKSTDRGEEDDPNGYKYPANAHCTASSIGDVLAHLDDRIVYDAFVSVVTQIRDAVALKSIVTSWRDSRQQRTGMTPLRKKELTYALELGLSKQPTVHRDAGEKEWTGIQSVIKTLTSGTTSSHSF